MLQIDAQHLPPQDLDYECRVFHVNPEWPRSQRIAFVNRRWEIEEEHNQTRELIPVEGTSYDDEINVIRRRIRELLQITGPENHHNFVPNNALTRLYNTTLSLYRWEKHVKEWQCNSFSILEAGLSNVLHHYMTRTRNFNMIFNRLKHRILLSHERRQSYPNWINYYSRNEGKFTN